MKFFELKEEFFHLVSEKYFEKLELLYVEGGVLLSSLCAPVKYECISDPVR